MFNNRWSKLGEQIFDRDVLGGPDPPRRINTLGDGESAQSTELLGGQDPGDQDLLARPLMTMGWPPWL